MERKLSLALYPPQPSGSERLPPFVWNFFQARTGWWCARSSRGRGATELGEPTQKSKLFLSNQGSSWCFSRFFLHSFTQSFSALPSGLTFVCFYFCTLSDDVNKCGSHRRRVLWKAGKAAARRGKRLKVSKTENTQPRTVWRTNERAKCARESRSSSPLARKENITRLPSTVGVLFT